MTVSTADLREEYVATAGQTVFTFNFRVFGNTDVKVYQTPAGVDFDDATYLITAYTMTPNADQDASQGGVVTLDSGATLGDRITIISDVSETRSTDYKDGGVFDPDLVDNDMDRSLSIAKQAKEAIRLAPRFNESAHGASGIQLPELTPNTIWRVNAAGTALEAITLGDGVVANGIPLANYAALRAYDSSSLADGQIITLSDNGGYFVVKSGAVSDDGFNLIVFNDNSSRYSQRIEPAYSNSLTLKQIIDYNDDSRQALVEGSGQTFSASDTDQEHKAVANYSVLGLEVGDSGTANAHVLTLGTGRETLDSLDQLLINYPVSAANTGAVTVDFSALLGESAGTTVKDLRDINDNPLIGGECAAGGIVVVAYNTTTGRAQLINPLTDETRAVAWANMKGDGVVEIRDSVGITSITDLGIGYFRITLTDEMDSENYCVVATPGWDSGLVGNRGFVVNNYTTTTFDLYCVAGNTNVVSDPEVINVHVFGRKAS